MTYQQNCHCFFWIIDTLILHSADMETNYLQLEKEPVSSASSASEPSSFLGSWGLGK